MPDNRPVEPGDDHVYIVHTRSGSRYIFDNSNLTWRRKSDHAIPYVSHDWDQSGGDLAAPVEPRLGHRLTFFLPGDGWIVTSEVTNVATADPEVLAKFLECVP